MHTTVTDQYGSLQGWLSNKPQNAHIKSETEFQSNFKIKMAY